MSQIGRIFFGFILDAMLWNTTIFTFFISPPACAEARCPGDVSPIRFRPLTLGQIAVPVMLNQSGPYEFMVDTGTQFSVIDPALAAGLHLQPQGTIGVLSFSRWADQPWLMLDQIQVGPYAVQNIAVVIASLQQIQSRDPKVRGILSANFLAHFDLLIDNERRFLCFDQSTQMQGQMRGDRVPVIDESDSAGAMALPPLVRISTQLCGNASPVRIMRLDSGAGVAVLYDNHLARRSTVSGNNLLRGHVIGGASQFLTELPLQDLRIGKHLLSQIPFMSPSGEASSNAPKGEDGLLPTSLFDRVFISFAGRFVVFNPR